MSYSSRRRMECGIMDVSCHLVVVSMAVIMFGAMCRYDDVSVLRWRNIRFVEDGSGFEITFEKRKNA